MKAERRSISLRCGVTTALHFGRDRRGSRMMTRQWSVRRAGAGSSKRKCLLGDEL